MACHMVPGSVLIAKETIRHYCRARMLSIAWALFCIHVTWQGSLHTTVISNQERCLTGQHSTSRAYSRLYLPNRQHPPGFATHRQQSPEVILGQNLGKYSAQTLRCLSRTSRERAWIYSRALTLTLSHLLSNASRIGTPLLKDTFSFSKQFSLTPVYPGLHPHLSYL